MGAPKGHPRFGGRKPGVPNKVTAEVRDLARVHGPAVLEELARLALESESDQARVAAAKEILDRAYGNCLFQCSGCFSAQFLNAWIIAFAVTVPV
jgi:hypothetical protein